MSNKSKNNSQITRKALNPELVSPKKSQNHASINPRLTLSQKSVHVEVNNAITLPDAKSVEAWQKLYPDAPEKLFKVFEENAKHSRKMEGRALKYTLIDRLTITGMGVLLSVFCVIIALHAMVGGYGIEFASIFISIPVFGGIAKLVKALSSKSSSE